jgi:hypothetical protein
VFLFNIARTPVTLGMGGIANDKLHMSIKNTLKTHDVFDNYEFRFF